VLHGLEAHLVDRARIARNLRELPCAKRGVLRCRKREPGKETGDFAGCGLADRNGLREVVEIAELKVA